MKYLSGIGRIFFGISIATLGLQTIFYKDFPYMLIPLNHSWVENLVIITYIFGTLLILAGVWIVFGRKIMPVALLLGIVLLMIFCFYFVPYQFFASSGYLHLGEWENAEKELALSGGAFVIAGCFSQKDQSAHTRFLKKLMPFGIILFCITIISFGLDHFLYAKEVADYIPSWIPHHLFWIYVAGSALAGSGIAIILKIGRGLFATLLGAMIFTWFIILHIPKAIADPPSDKGGEVTSAFLALAYCGIALVIAGNVEKTWKVYEENK